MTRAPGVRRAALVRAAGSPERARAAFAFIRSMLILELNGRFPDDGGLEPAWRTGLAAFDSPAWWLDRNDHRHRERPVGRSQ